MDNFGSAPLVTKPSDVIKQLPSKTSRKDIYQFVVNELTESIPYLNESAGPDMYGRFNKWAAKMVLAAVYLNAKVYTGKAEWDKCLKQVNDVINSGLYSLTPHYRDMFKVHNEHESGMIFAIPFDEIYAHNWNWLYASWHAQLKYYYQTKAAGFGAGSIKMVPQFGAIYDSLRDKRYDETWLMGYVTNAVTGDTLTGLYDERGEPLFFSRFFKNGVYTSEDAGFRIDKYQVAKGATRHLSNDFPFFRYARALMMKAECLLRTGRAAQAASIVTHVRMRDFDKAKYAKVTASELLGDSKINYGYWQHGRVVSHATTAPIKYGGFLDELGREFACEFYRRRDMIRFGVYESRSYLEHRPNGKYHTVFPIPAHVVQANPRLKQNPNYQ